MEEHGTSNFQVAEHRTSDLSIGGSTAQEHTLNMGGADGTGSHAGREADVR
jgi:hypothetical protein